MDDDDKREPAADPTSPEDPSMKEREQVEPPEPQLALVVDLQARIAERLQAERDAAFDAGESFRFLALEDDEFDMHDVGVVGEEIPAETMVCWLTDDPEGICMSPDLAERLGNALLAAAVIARKFRAQGAN